MKATGIVRRIDDLGRVVIPKEIRRTLRIREGDPLEIYTATDGEVIFKKYSPVGELAEFASQYADVLAKISSMPTIITDRDHVIAAAGVSKREFLERRVTTVLEGYMENRKTYSATQQTLGDIQPIEGIEHYASVIYPIIAAGDVSGAVVMLTGEQTKIPTNAEIKLEIYTATDGEVIFKKYSPVGELAEFASQYADVLAKISSMPTIITDRDHVIAAAGVSKREFLERRVTTVLEGYMENRKTYSATQQTLGDIQPIEGIEHYASVIYPIIAAGDVSGAVVMLTGEQTKIPTNAEIKLAQTAAAFLGKQMEE